MNCAKHPDTTAIGFCCGCGRTVCAKCDQPEPYGKLACSPECRKEIAERDSALKTLLTRSTRSTIGAGIYTIILGISFICVGLYHIFFDPAPLRILLGLAMGSVLFISGIIYIKIAKKK